MVKKIVIITGAILLFSASGAATVLGLSALNPQESPETAKVVTTTEPDTQAADTPATPNPDQAPATDPNTSVSSDTPTEPDETTALQNDVQVKNTTASIVSAFHTYAANNRGAFPTSSAALTNFQNAYLTNINLENPANGTLYSVQTGKNVDTKTAFHFQTNTQCSEDNTAVIEVTSKRQFSVSVTLPSGSLYCQGS